MFHTWVGFNSEKLKITFLLQMFKQILFSQNEKNKTYKKFEKNSFFQVQKKMIASREHEKILQYKRFSLNNITNT